MTFREIRNALVERLWNYMDCPIVLADQVQPEAQLPYGIYSVSTPYAPDRGMGDYTTREAEGGNAEITRMEMPSATFSFTFCSQNRTLIIDEAARRVGFDVRIRYTRQDTRVVSSVETAPITEKE